MSRRLLGSITDDTLSSHNPATQQWKDWNARVAVRGIVTNDQGQIALMYVGIYSTYKLPGGGVDEGESLEAAFSREILEETGCTIKDTQECGVFLEQRDDWQMVQVSFVYTAQVVEYGQPTLTEKEEQEGFQLMWVDSVRDAIELIQDTEAEGYGNQFMKARDIQILKSFIDA